MPRDAADRDRPDSTASSAPAPRGRPRPVHCCLLDRDCWRDRRRFGAPMRLYVTFRLTWPVQVHVDRFFTLLPARDDMWDSEPVEVVVDLDDPPPDHLG